MGKLGTSDNPIRLRVNNEQRMEEVVLVCEKNNWKFICGIEFDQDEDVSELEYLLDPKKFSKRPKMKKMVSKTIQHTALTIGRNEPCPCGSGLKHKKCCLST